MEIKKAGRSIEPFDPKRHVREGFACGVESLDAYFQTRAGQDHRKNLAAIFVLLEGSRVLGYYTLSCYAIDPGKLPPEEVRKLPRYPLFPATLIGRLVIDRSYQGQGLGAYLLLNALERCLQNRREVASMAVVVEAENDRALQFYLAYGFIPFPGRPDKLFLPMKTVEKMFAEAASP